MKKIIPKLSILFFVLLCLVILYGCTKEIVLGASDVMNPITGKIWMDKNLGASRVATSSKDEESYGDLYQWGRGADGHQIRTSGTTTTKSSSDIPGHGNFILTPNSTSDWRNPQNKNLWKGESGVNNPCPSGYRLPTEAEWNAEIQSWGTDNSDGAFASPLKLPAAGCRDKETGQVNNYFTLDSFYWSSTVDDTSPRCLYFTFSSANVPLLDQAYGCSVRCIKD